MRWLDGITDLMDRGMVWGGRREEGSGWPGRVGVFIQLSSSVRKALSFCIDQAAVAAPGSVMREPPRGGAVPMHVAPTRP